MTPSRWTSNKPVRSLGSRTENDTVGRKKSTTMRVEEFFRQQFLLKSSDARHRSACNGDSGGPLYLETGGQKVVSGVTSWGPPGCEVDDSFYVAVKPHLEWIRANIPAATTGLREKQKYFGPMGCGESVACREGCGNDGFCCDDCMEETSSTDRFSWKKSPAVAWRIV